MTSKHTGAATASEIITTKRNILLQSNLGASPAAYSTSTLKTTTNGRQSITRNLKIGSHRTFETLGSVETSQSVNNALRNLTSQQVKMPLSLYSHTHKGNTASSVSPFSNAQSQKQIANGYMKLEKIKDFDDSVQNNQMQYTHTMQQLQKVYGNLSQKQMMKRTMDAFAKSSDLLQKQQVIYLTTFKRTGASNNKGVPQTLTPLRGNHTSKHQASAQNLRLPLLAESDQQSQQQQHQSNHQQKYLNIAQQQQFKSSKGKKYTNMMKAKQKSHTRVKSLTELKGLVEGTQNDRIPEQVNQSGQVPSTLQLVSSVSTKVMIRDESQESKNRRFSMLTSQKKRVFHTQEYNHIFLAKSSGYPSEKTAAQTNSKAGQGLDSAADIARQVDKQDSKISLTKNNSSSVPSKKGSNQSLTKIMTLRKKISRNSQLMRLKTGRESIKSKKSEELISKIKEVKEFFDKDHSQNSDSDTLMSMDSISDLSKNQNENKEPKTEHKPRQSKLITVCALEPSFTNLFESPIFEATLKNDKHLLMESVQCLPSQYEKNKKLNLQDKFGRTPLFYAVYHNNYDMVDFMMSQGSDPMYSDLKGRTVLHYACLNNVTKNLVQLILDFNERLDIENTHYDKAKENAASRKQNEFDIPQKPVNPVRQQITIGIESLSPRAVIQRPQKPEEQIKVSVSQPMTSLLPKKKKVLDLQNLSVIKDDESQMSKSSKISKKEEDITPTSSGGQHYTSRLQQIALSKPTGSQLLLARKQTKLKIDTLAAKNPQHQLTIDQKPRSSVSSQHAEERARIHQEIQLKKTDAYQKQAKVFINFADEKGKTALHYAVMKSNYHLVKLLLEKKAIPCIRDHKGQKPIDIAEAQEIKDLIVQHETFFIDKHQPNRRASMRKSLMLLDDQDKNRLMQNIQDQRRKSQQSIQESLNESDSSSCTSFSSKGSKSVSGKPQEANNQIKKYYHRDKQVMLNKRLNSIELSSMSDKLLAKFNLGIYKDNALTYKIRFDDQEAFQYLLRRGVSLLTTNPQGFNLIHLAMKIERLEYLCYMLEGSFTSSILERALEGMSYNQRPELFDIQAHQKAKKLIEIIEKGECPWIVEALLALEKTVESDGNTTLHIAIDLGNHEMFSYIMSMLRIRDHMRTLNQEKYMDMFKTSKVVLELKNYQQATPLLWSAKRNQYKIFQELVSHGAQIYTQCSKMMNPLHYAVLNNNQGMVEQLTFADAENDRLVNEKNFRNQTPAMLDDLKKFDHIFNHVWAAASLPLLAALEQLEQLLVSEKYNCNQKTLIGQNTPLHLAVLGENIKAIEYLCRFPDINLYERNVFGQTPRDIALLLPKRRVAYKIIDFLNKKISVMKSQDGLKLTPSGLGPQRQGGASPLLRRATFKGSRAGQSSGHRQNFSIVPQSTLFTLQQQNQSKPLTFVKSINFDAQIKVLTESMAKMIVSMERSNSVMGKRHASSNSIDSSENDDLFEEESSHGSNMLISQNSMGLGGGGSGNGEETKPNNPVKNQHWDAKKVGKLLQIYDNFIEKRDVMGIFNHTIFERFKSQLTKQDEKYEQLAKDIFRHLDERRKGSIKPETVGWKIYQQLAVKENEIFADKVMVIIRKQYWESKVTEANFIKIVVNSAKSK